MKKNILLLGTLLSCTISILAGCNFANEHADDKKTVSSSSTLNVETQSINSLGEPTVIEGLEITIKEPEKKEVINEKENKILYTINIKGKNISSVSKGIGSIDFRLQTKDGKKFSVSKDYNIFGKELNTNEEVEGDLYFVLSKKESVDQLVYLLNDQKHITWDLNKK
ncbi:hypothetical protein D920_00117 [Enterococcus faecalis 13-SD-W-01]|nr:hypothetical protein D920_00117 [Enterococcus faecalis 13-SD-W-01]